MELLGVYGASGFGREVLPLVRAQRAAESHKCVFVDDRLAGQTLNGHEVLSFAQFLETEASYKAVAIAIADGTVRRRLAERCYAAGIAPLDVRAANVVQLDENQIGVGAILCPFVMITSNARIGSHFHANIYSYVAHDCVIGDFVTFAPSVCCNGNVVIEDGAYIGTGAVLKQGTVDKPIVIGREAVVGMGAVVTKNVPPGAVVVGNPARALERTS